MCNVFADFLLWHLIDFDVFIKNSDVYNLYFRAEIALYISLNTFYVIIPLNECLYWHKGNCSYLLFTIYEF